MNKQLHGSLLVMASLLWAFAAHAQVDMEVARQEARRLVPSMGDIQSQLQRHASPEEQFLMQLQAMSPRAAAMMRQRQAQLGRALTAQEMRQQLQLPEFQEALRDKFGDISGAQQVRPYPHAYPSVR